MSRSGYSEDYDDQWALIRWRGAVASAIRGRHGQAFLKELLSALDALPEKALIAGDLEHQGQVCALGAVGKARGVDMTSLDPYDAFQVSNIFNIAEALAKEIAWINDEASWYRMETPERRFDRVREWVVSKIKTAQ